jgi:hypothetical protein
MIRRVDGGWKVFSESGKPLSKVLESYAAAVARLNQVEYFAAKDKSEEEK